MYIYDPRHTFIDAWWSPAHSFILDWIPFFVCHILRAWVRNLGSGSLFSGWGEKYKMTFLRVLSEAIASKNNGLPKILEIPQSSECILRFVDCPLGVKSIPGLALLH